MRRNSRRAIGFAFIARGLILCRIPRFCEFLAFRSQRNRLKVALGSRGHPVTPILRDKRNPVPGQIYRRRYSRWLRRPPPLPCPQTVDATMEASITPAQTLAACRSILTLNNLFSAPLTSNR